MKLKNIFLCLLVCLSCKSLKPESSCKALTVKKMTPLDNQKMDIEVYFGSSKYGHINYPYISKVVNSKGDTVAKGEMAYYAMMPNTSDVFNLQVQPNQIIDKGKYKIIFIHDNKTCMLRYTF